MGTCIDLKISVLSLTGLPIPPQRLVLPKAVLGETASLRTLAGIGARWPCAW